MESSLLVNFQEYIRKNSLLTKDDRVLAAVSGGVDSMVMLSLLIRSGYDTSVAHCNFQLRGEEAYEDEVLVEKEAGKYGIPAYNVRFDTAAEMERTGESVQIAARRLRYEWFEKLCAEHGCTVVAIAHHADDSIETFFINMLRGTGLRGLTGISTVNGRVVRPLLFASRRDILDYAQHNGIDFREDSSNRSTKYLRNKIRLGIVPSIKEIKPGFADVMGGTIKRLTDAQLFIDRGVERIRDEVEEHVDGMVVIDPAKIDAAFPRGFVIYELLVKYGFKGDVVDALCNTLEGGVSGKRFYSKDHVAYTDRSRVIVTPISDEDECEVVIRSLEGRSYCGNSVFSFEKLDIDDINSLEQPADVALLDADRLVLPLRARRWREGDRFRPLGMEGFKKVSDYLIDAKVSQAEKKRQFVLISGEDIVWLAGRRIDDRFKITPATENVLKVTKEVL